jgi:hypothetical protein
LLVACAPFYCAFERKLSRKLAQPVLQQEQGIGFGHALCLPLEAVGAVALWLLSAARRQTKATSAAAAAAAAQQQQQQQQQHRHQQQQQQ